MSSRMKYGSLSRSFGKLVSSTLKQQQQQQPPESPTSSMSTASLYGTLPRKSGKKRKSDELTPELTNGLRKLSGSRAIPAELVEWVNTIELREKDIAERSQSKLLKQKSKEKVVEKDQGAPVVAGGDADPITSAASSFPRRRGSIKPRIALSEAVDTAAAGKNVKSGQLYVRVVEMKHKHKTLREDKVFVVVVSVQKCSLATVPMPYSQAVSFEEGFVFEITGDFDIKVEVFLQSKEKSSDNKYEIPESLGMLNFTGLTTLSLEMLTGSYLLTKDGVETTTSVTLQLAIKLNEEEEPSRELLPKPDHSGCLSYQVPHGVTYNWNMDECELRGRSLRFYHDNKKFLTIRIDPNTVAKKADTYSSEISLPYNCFQVIVCGKPVYLLAQTRPEMKEWIEKINKGIQADVF